MKKKWSCVEKRWNLRIDPFLDVCLCNCPWWQATTYRDGKSLSERLSNYFCFRWTTGLTSIPKLREELATIILRALFKVGNLHPLFRDTRSPRSVGAWAATPRSWTKGRLLQMGQRPRFTSNQKDILLAECSLNQHINVVSKARVSWRRKLLRWHGCIFA